MKYTNGRPINGHPRSPARTVEEESDQTDENIFLFVPNLIGMRRLRSEAVSRADKLWNRLLASRPRSGIPLLHATPPTPM
jgi:hypothetical protein